MRAMRLESFTAVLAITLGLLLTACGQSAPNSPVASTAIEPAANSTGQTAPSSSVGAATVEFSSTQYSASQATESISLTVTRSGSATAAASVAYGTVAGTGTAVSGVDYTFTKGTLSWAENDSTSRTISVPISKAVPFSGTKSFRVQLWAPSAGLAIINLGSATAEIVGDKSESAGTLQFTKGTYSVAQNAGTLTVGVTRAGGATGAVGVKYATATETATGANFTAETHTLQWSDGDTSTEVVLDPHQQRTAVFGQQDIRGSAV